jgi:hypothetical protein
MVPPILAWERPSVTGKARPVYRVKTTRRLSTTSPVENRT